MFLHSTRLIVVENIKHNIRRNILNGKVSRISTLPCTHSQANKTPILSTEQENKKLRTQAKSLKALCLITSCINNYICLINLG